MPYKQSFSSDSYGQPVWPAVSYESVEWIPVGRPPREDRLLRTYDASIPALIAKLPVRLGAEAMTVLNDATVAIVRLDTEVGADFLNVASSLLRSESVASSKIERLNATSQELGIAALHQRNRTEATVVLRNVESMQLALKIASTNEDFAVTDILAVHRTLMRDDPFESHSAGIIRTEQNWIGGSDYSPRDALFVPPQDHRVSEFLDDLVRFMNRTDIPALAQAFITHAQFETIHPFTDGNGRTGRALLHATSRRSGITKRVAIPTSAVLLADIDMYFASLTAYRGGDLDSYILHLGRASMKAADETHTLVTELDDIRARWIEVVKPRSGSAISAIIDFLPRQPVVGLEALQDMTSVHKSSLYRAIDSLVESGILSEITGDRRNQIWAATELLDAVDGLIRRLGKRQLPPKG